MEKIIIKKYWITYIEKTRSALQIYLILFRFHKKSSYMVAG